MVRRRDLYYELLTLQNKLSNTLVDGKHKQDLISRIEEVTSKIENENQNIFLDVKEIDLIEFRQQIINKYPDLLDIFQLYWYTFSPFLDIDESLSYNGFERFNCLLYFALVGNKNDHDAKKITHLDYDYYIKIYTKIDKVAFFDILFKILVEWTDKDDILHYCCFMWTLLDIIADLKWNPPRLRPKREIKNILKTESDITMFSRYFDGKEIREKSLTHFEYWKKVDTKAKLRVSTRRVGANLDETQIKAIADIYYSKASLSSDDDDPDSDLDSEDGTNINNEKKIGSDKNSSPKDKNNIKPTGGGKSHEEEYYERLRNVKGKVNSWNNRKFVMFTWDPEDKNMLDSIYQDRGGAVKMLKYFDNDDYIEDQMEQANVHAINVLKKFGNNFKARETMYEKKHVLREREIREKVIVPSRPVAKPRITPQMMRAKVIVKERGIGAFMQATKGAAAKESKKSWATLAKIMENRNRRRVKRESMIKASLGPKTFTPLNSELLDEIKEEEDERGQMEELEELLHQQLLEEAEIEKAINALSVEEILQLELESKQNEELETTKECAVEEEMPTLVNAYLTELNEHDRPDDMTDNLSDAEDYILHDSFSPSNVLKSKMTHKLKALPQTAFLVVRSSPAPETNLKMKDELDIRKQMRKTKVPLFPRSFITNSGEFLTASNLHWKPQKDKEILAVKNEAKKSLNFAIKKSKDENHTLTVSHVRHIKDDIVATKMMESIKNEKRFDQIRSFKQFRRRMLAFLKESKNPHSTDCMRFMNEQMVNIILNKYNNIDPNILISELFGTVEQNDKFIKENSNNPRGYNETGISCSTYMVLNEDFQNFTSEQSFDKSSEILDSSEFGIEKIEKVETISTNELLCGKFSPLASVRNIHPDQETYGNRKYWNALNPGWHTFGSGFRSQSPTSSLQTTSSPRSRSPSPLKSSQPLANNKILTQKSSEGISDSNLGIGESRMSQDMNYNITFVTVTNDNGDDGSIDDSIDGDIKSIRLVNSPSVEIPYVRNVYTPQTPDLLLSREVTPLLKKELVESFTPTSNDYLKFHEKIQLDHSSSSYDPEGSRTDISVNTTNLIISQNKNLMRLQPITPPAIFTSVDSFSIGISPQLFDNSKPFERRIIRNNQPSTIIVRKSAKYNQLRLFPNKSKSLEIISTDNNDDISISKNKIILKLNELKVKEASNCLYSTKQKTIEGRFRSGTSVTPKRQLLNMLAGNDKKLKPFCGM